METKTRRLVVCDKCRTKYVFIVPGKPGVYRIECPLCNKETKFKVTMETKTRRLVVCDKCRTKYVFIVPGKPGVYRIECPLCNKETKFKVTNDK